MKKILAILLLACLTLSLAACGAHTAAPAEQPAAQTTEQPVEQPAEETVEQPAEAEYKLGLGVSLNMNSSEGTNAQVDATAIAVVLDAEGKIVAARLDVAQNKMDVTDGQVDTEAAFLTKYEKGDDYNMVKFSDATLEWYEQAANFEAYLIGKTVDEVKATETVEDGAHIVFADEDLHASCSISVSEFIGAAVKACEDEQAMSFTSDGNFTLGLAINSTAAESTAATAEEDGVVKMYSEFGSVVVDAEGKILAALTDATQPQITINAEGVVETKFGGTKRELKEDYNMVKYSDATLEWYEQAWNFVSYAVGKTADELKATETVEDGAHIVLADEELHASCSISVQGMINVLVKAAEMAR